MINKSMREHVCMHVFICVCAYMHSCMCLFAHVCMHVCTKHSHIIHYIQQYSHKITTSHDCAHVCMYACTHTKTTSHVNISSPFPEFTCFFTVGFYLQKTGLDNRKTFIEMKIQIYTYCIKSYYCKYLNFRYLQ